MNLVTRFSAFFLLSLGLVLAGFSVLVYNLVAVHLWHSLDAEVRAKLDRFEAGPGFDDSRVSWAFFDRSGRPLDGSDAFIHEVSFEGRDLASLPEDSPFTHAGREGRRWRVLLRQVLDGRGRHGPRGPRHPPGDGRGPRPHEHDGFQEPGDNSVRSDAHGGRDRPPQTAHLPAARVAAGARLDSAEADLRALAALLALASLGLWGLAAVIGRQIGRRALAPLSRMAEAASMMRHSDVHQRLPSPETGDELEDFARSFNGLLDRLNESLERQKQFTGQASHQLRTPLAGVIAAIEVARRRPRSVQEHERVLDRVHGDSLRLWEVVEALLFLARADAEAVLPDLEPINLADWLPDHLHNWSGHTRAADITVEVEEGPLCVAAHQALLGQLLDSLLENACKYSEPGTPIRVRSRSNPCGVTLSVEDQGCGIAAKDLPHIFDPFYRAENTRRLGCSGVGLGLAIAQRIASAFAATITVESNEENGSRLVVQFPEERAGPGVPPEKR